MPLIILPNAFGDAATNMAVDASLLYTLPKGIAAFRHYGWTEPAITFGYTQRIAEVQTAFPDEDLRLCRRLTGGGIVDHRNDWTYALAIQSDLPAANTSATELYATLHGCIQQALDEQLIKSQLAPCQRACGQTPKKNSTAPDQCFVHPTTDDVLRLDGTKIAGAAMKRAREGLLIQGSIDRGTLPENFDFNTFATTFQQGIARELAIPIGTTEDLRTLFDGPRIQQERERFQSTAWLQKR
ncbi:MULTISPECIES: lipoate--protein ligase family protein [unclassified Lentimonas]|uniref:lipoate--protein ligase family protein n=1 Tax=unclassified Lentimonas TaxID=2630993 RepID=UPI0013229E1F|nr:MULTISPECIES: lipoate--protein ligase family protein [unclassified Lentimonas]CAA6691564.1 Lipoate-protein ligase A [Lentimonas sp. CC10]CAA6696228.1 Lipoate-protein ligase A [Lentimonas sp. CC19]CAA7070871.1 Lipoate-protein ligase A [Lentimonas sp. CC11]